MVGPIPFVHFCSTLLPIYTEFWYLQDSFYKTLDADAHRRAFLNEYDFDSPDAIDFDVLVSRLQDLKAG